MDIWDWIMAGAMVILPGIIFYLIYPPYGALIGIGLGLLLTWRAKKNRDKARSYDQPPK
jgi:hypothetical protein